LQRALGTLEFMVSIDIYVNETTRHANVILPPERELARGHYDMSLYQLAIRNVANYSPPLVELGADEVPEWRTMLRLAGVLAGQGAHTDVDALDDGVIASLAQKAVARAGSNVAGRDADELLKALAARRGPERVLDLMLRTGPYGDGFGADPDGLSLEKLEAHPHGIDFGPLQPRMPDALRTPTGRIELAPEMCIADLARARGAIARFEANAGGLVLVGRRDLRSNNSWMHNLPKLVSGKPRCVLFVHPQDAAAAGIIDGGSALLESRVHRGEVPVRVTDEVMPGVVSLPHGFGHQNSGGFMSVAAAHAGVSANDWTDDQLVESVVGQSVLNGVPVRLRALAPGERADAA
jgi:anaerobic selenocysteine-containing dehydrogenase